MRETTGNPLKSGGMEFAPPFDRGWPPEFDGASAVRGIVAFPQWSELGFEMKRFGARLIRGATFEGFLDGGTRAMSGLHPGSEQRMKHRRTGVLYVRSGRTV
jgi:hypothetical protein